MKAGGATLRAVDGERGQPRAASRPLPGDRTPAGARRASTASVLAAEVSYFIFNYILEQPVAESWLVKDEQGSF